jgi:hypothetical protein
MKGKNSTGMIIALAIGFVTGVSLFGANIAHADSNLICGTVTYSAWTNCINGVQTRDVIDASPIGCTLTASEQAGRNQTCGKVLGAKIYAAGTLLRNPEGKIFVVVSGQKIRQIMNSTELKAYSGQTIHNVSAAFMTQYQVVFGQVLGAKIYADGTLLRGPDKKIYVIVNGKKQHIHSLTELYQYRKHRIINVSASVLADF